MLMLFNKKKVIVLAMLVYFLTSATTYGVLSFWQRPVKTDGVKTDEVMENNEELIPTPLPTSATEKVWALLFLGYGGAGHQGGYLTDVMQEVVILPQEKVVATIHIPRDIVVEYPLKSGSYKKINSLFPIKSVSGDYPRVNLQDNQAETGAQLAEAYVGMVTGITPQAYIGVDFISFKKTIDALGGITVDVPRGFTDPWYPVTGRELELCGWSPQDVTAMSATMSGFTLEKQFPCRYETITFKQEPTLMNGETALKFVRSRHSSSDFARGQRQSAVLEAVLAKLLTVHDTTRWQNVLTNVKQLITTDVRGQMELDLLAELPNLKNYRQIEIGLDTNMGLVSSNTGGGAGLTAANGDWSVIHTLIENKLHAE